MTYVEFMKSFFSPIRANWWVLESFRPPKPKKVRFPFSRHDVRRVHKKFFYRWFARTDGCKSYFGLLSVKTFHSDFLDTMYVEFMKSFFSPIRANWWVLESFRPPEPKNVWFPITRHDVRRVHKKLFSRWFAQTDRCYSHFALLSLKTFDSHLLDIMYVEFIKNFFSLIRANWWVLESFRFPEPKNVWFPLSRHDVPRVHEKFLLAHSSELMGVRVISATWAQKRLIPTF